MAEERWYPVARNVMSPPIPLGRVVFTDGAWWYRDDAGRTFRWACCEGCAHGRQCAGVAGIGLGVRGPFGNVSSLAAGRYQVTGTNISLRKLDDPGTIVGRLNGGPDWPSDPDVVDTTGKVVIGGEEAGIPPSEIGLYFAEAYSPKLQTYGWITVEYLAPMDWGYATKREAPSLVPAPTPTPAAAPAKPSVPVAVAGAHWTSYALVGLAVAGVFVAAAAVLKRT